MKQMNDIEQQNESVTISIPDVLDYPPWAPKIPVIICEICYDQMSQSNQTTLIIKSECNHNICSNCMKIYIMALIDQRAHESKFVCPSNGCFRPISRQEVLQHTGEDNARTYSSLIASQKEELKKIMRCADCNESLKPIDYENHDILVCKSLNCQNDNKKHGIDAFCFYCKSKIEWRVEASSTYQAWASFKSSLNKIRYRGRTNQNFGLSPAYDGRDLNYVHVCKNEDARIVKNFSMKSRSIVKHCPQCFNVIQKNEGCSHMHCLYCNYHFCWDCLNPSNTHGTCPAHQLPLHWQFLSYIISFGRYLRRNFGSIIYRYFFLIVFAVLFILSPIIYPVKKVYKTYRRWRDRKKYEEFLLQQNRRIERTIYGLDVIVYLTDNTNDQSHAFYDSSFPTKGYIFDLRLQSKLVVRELLGLNESQGRWMNHETEEVSPNFDSSFQPDATFISHEFGTAIVRIHIKLVPRAKIDGLPVIYVTNPDFVIRIVEPVSTAYNEDRSARSSINGKISL